MSDLISRSELLKRLEEWNTSDKTDKALYNFALHRIIEQSTAYDVDKVVEELKELHEIYLNRYGIIGNSSLGAIERAIEIVKHGGVSDDVCEYKIKDKVIYASCNNKQIASAFCWFNECGDYKYCPYCGKKIKVV